MATANAESAFSFPHLPWSPGPRPSRRQSLPPSGQKQAEKRSRPPRGTGHFLRTTKYVIP